MADAGQKLARKRKRVHAKCLRAEKIAGLFHADDGVGIGGS